MECHPWAEGDFQGAVIAPLPPDRQAWHQLAISIHFYEVFEDVIGHPRKVTGIFIHNPQFPPWHWDLLPNATAPPAEGHEHKDDTPEGELSHGNPSLTAASAHDGPSPHDGRRRAHWAEGDHQGRPWTRVMQPHRLSRSNIHHRRRQILTTS